MFHWIPQVLEMSKWPHADVEDERVTNTLGIGSFSNYKDTYSTIEDRIEYSEIGKNITEAKNGVETYMVDANYTDSDKTEYVAKVVYDDYDGLENAKENGDVELDTYALEDDTIDPETGECMSKPLDDLKVALNQ